MSIVNFFNSFRESDHSFRSKLMPSKKENEEEESDASRLSRAVRDAGKYADGIAAVEVWILDDIHLVQPEGGWWRDPNFEAADEDALDRIENKDHKDYVAPPSQLPGTGLAGGLWTMLEEGHHRGILGMTLFGNWHDQNPDRASSVARRQTIFGGRRGSIFSGLDRSRHSSRQISCTLKQTGDTIADTATLDLSPSGQSSSIKPQVQNPIAAAAAAVAALDLSDHSSSNSDEQNHPSEATNAAAIEEPEQSHQSTKADDIWISKMESGAAVDLKRSSSHDETPEVSELPADRSSNHIQTTPSALDAWRSSMQNGNQTGSKTSNQKSSSRRNTFQFARSRSVSTSSSRRLAFSRRGSSWLSSRSIGRSASAAIFDSNVDAGNGGDASINMADGAADLGYENPDAMFWRDIHSLTVDPDQPTFLRLNLLEKAGLSKATGVRFEIRGQKGIVLFIAGTDTTEERLNAIQNCNYMRSAADLVGAVAALTKPKKAIEAHVAATSGTIVGSSGAEENQETGDDRAIFRQVKTWARKLKGGDLQPPPPMASNESILTFVGTFVTLLVLCQASLQIKDASAGDYSIVMGPFGALMTLQYGLTMAPASQPRNAFYGQAVAITIAMLFALIPEVAMPLWLRIPLAAATAIASLTRLGITHPPAGATAVIVASGGFDWMILPLMLLGVTISILTATMLNNLSEKRQYPTFWYVRRWLILPKLTNIIQD